MLHERFGGIRCEWTRLYVCVSAGLARETGDCDSHFYACDGRYTSFFFFFFFCISRVLGAKLKRTEIIKSTFYTIT